MRTVVLSLGGSLIVPEDIDTDFLIRFKDFVNSHKLYLWTAPLKLNE